MGASKTLHQHYREMQESYHTDIDCSGQLYQESQKKHRHELKVTINNHGTLYKAFLNKERIYEIELFKILGITRKTPLNLEYHLSKFMQNNMIKFNVEIQEINID